MLINLSGKVTMKLSNTKLTIALLLAVILFVIVNTLVVVEPFRSAISLVVLFVIPGYSLLILTRARIPEPVQRALYTLGLSILYLMVCGLIVNTIGVVFTLAAPLSRVPILAALSLSLAVVLVVNLYHNRGQNYQIVLPHIQAREIGMYAVPPLLTLLSIWGATLLN